MYEKIPITPSQSFVSIDPEDDVSWLNDGPGDGLESPLITDASFESHYLNADLTAHNRALDGMQPIDENAFNEWQVALDPDKRAALDKEKLSLAEMQDLAVEVHRKLIDNVPELYEARLPQPMEELLGGVRYAIGFNQSMASTSQEADRYLREGGGVNITGNSLQQRFLLYDAGMDGSYLGPDADNYIAGAIERGYYNNPNLGRFVAVFPEAHPIQPYTDERVRGVVNIEPSVVPDDLEITTPGHPGTSVINSKYVAGFIDKDGLFWANQNFLQVNEPDLQVYAPS